MKNLSIVNANGWIPHDQKPVDIPAKKSIDVLSYINFLVSCMIPESSLESGPLQNGTYFITIQDDYSNEYGGSYFKINKISSSLSSLPTFDTYEVDIGYPSDNFVTSFQIDNDNSWSLIYNYSEKVNQQEYIYSIDNEGYLVRKYSPDVTTSGKYYETTPMQKAWWTRMTQFPIKATLVIKGLLRPSLLMTYVRVNAMFYGQRHISSGLYVITSQRDDIGSNGYKTTLSLLRIAGDDDYITTEQIETVSSTTKRDSETTHGGGGSTFSTQHGGGGSSFATQHGGGGTSFETTPNITKKELDEDGAIKIATESQEIKEKQSSSRVKKDARYYHEKATIERNNKLLLDIKNGKYRTH